MSLICEGGTLKADGNLMRFSRTAAHLSPSAPLAPSPRYDAMSRKVYCTMRCFRWSQEEEVA